MYSIFTAIVLFASFAMMVREGLWNNLISLWAILLGGIGAFGLHQPLTIYFDELTGGSYTYLLDFPVLWITFALLVGVIKQVANIISRHRVVFPGPIDNGGGAAVGFLAALAMTGFAMASFHAAPLSGDMMGGAYYYGDSLSETKQGFEGASSLTAPDVAWLRFVEMVLSPARLGQGGDAAASIEFDKLSGFSAPLFVHQHSRHRTKFASLDTTAVKR